MHKPTKRLIALKEVLISNDKNVRKSIISELRTLHDCEHPNILKSYGAFLTENGVSIALEYMNAGCLATILNKVEKIPENILCMITKQLLVGLEYLHNNAKVIHRDIKPHNILLTTKGVVKIADFGVSSQIKHSFDSLSYMSPERIMGQHYYSDIDLWSLGILLVEAVTGRYPYSDVDCSDQNDFWVLKKKITENPSPQLPKD
jgi:serine/threonine protein kinase